MKITNEGTRAFKNNKQLNIKIYSKNNNYIKQN